MCLFADGCDDSLVDIDSVCQAPVATSVPMAMGPSRAQPPLPTASSCSATVGEACCGDGTCSSGAACNLESSVCELCGGDDPDDNRFLLACQGASHT